jgi:hypothetical protein
MKKLFLILLFVSTTFISHAQIVTDNKAAVEMLKKFYIAYNTEWSTDKFPRLQKRLDSLQNKYCTIWLKKQLKEMTRGEGSDHDLLINDEYTDVPHLKTLKVVNDLGKPNTYIVSYVDHTMSPAYKPIDKTVVIHVTVVKENGEYKIANAYGDAVSLK